MGKITCAFSLAIVFMSAIGINRDVHAQILNRLPSGLGVETGLGHNQLYWKVKEGDQSGDRTELSFKPTFRLIYTVNMTSCVIAIPFIGYNEFGGKSEEEPNGYKDEIWFKAIEVGSLGLYHTRHLQVGCGFKINRHLSVINRHYGSLTDVPDSERSWEEEDMIEECSFTRWSYDLGAKLGYRIKEFSFSIEAWFGLNDLLKDSIFEPVAKAHQNHYRVLIGYVLP